MILNLRHVAMGLAFSALFALTACNNSAEKKAPVKPNIIYILADDLGIGDLGAYGQQKIKTPNLDEMAEQGLRFTDHYSGATVCAPSRGALMTGQHTGVGYIRGNKEVKPEGQNPIPTRIPVVAESLKAAGYTTGVIGKWGLGYPGSEGTPNGRGFDYFFGYNCQREAHHYYPEHLWRNEERIILEENLDGKRGAYTHDMFTEESIAFIKQNKDEPFFLYLAYSVPHADLDVPNAEMDQYDFEEKPFPGSGYLAQERPHAAYAGMVSRMDGDVGKIMNLLKELEIDENTLVIFTSDNGVHVEGGNDPDFFDSNAQFRGYKRDLYEGGIRTPFIAWWPGTVQPGVSEHISAFWDFFPTACDLAQVEIPASVNGVSYAPTLLGNAKEQQKHDHLYWEFHGYSGDKQAVRKGDWKAVRMAIDMDPNKPIELYNLAQDPGENVDLAEAHPEIAKEMTELMDANHTPSELWPFNHERENK